MRVENGTKFYTAFDIEVEFAIPIPTLNRKAKEGAINRYKFDGLTYYKESEVQHLKSQLKQRK